LAVDSGEQFASGTTFHNRYRVDRLIRSGGMGAVYEVLDLETRRRRALKTMLPGMIWDSEMRDRFRLEATIAAEIESDHIVEVFDAGVDDQTNLPFLVMELLKGEDLGGVLDRKQRLSPAEVVQLIWQASFALEKTHGAGIVHRDLKPENLFLTMRDDGTPRLKILDFGIAKVVAQNTRPNTTRSVGTPMYMSPEQIRGAGDVDPRADLYALGHIVYTLLVGRPYWTRESTSAGAHQAVLFGIARGAVEPASQRAAEIGVTLPPSFDRWFSRATAVEPSGRFDSASELAGALGEALGMSSPWPGQTAFVDIADRVGLVEAPAVKEQVRTLILPGPSEDPDMVKAASAPRPSRPASARLVHPIRIALVSVVTLVAVLALGFGLHRRKAVPPTAAGAQPAADFAVVRAAPVPVEGAHASLQEGASTLGIESPPSLHALHSSTRVSSVPGRGPVSLPSALPNVPSTGQAAPTAPHKGQTRAKPFEARPTVARKTAPESNLVQASPRSKPAAAAPAADFDPTDTR